MHFKCADYDVCELLSLYFIFVKQSKSFENTKNVCYLQYISVEKVSNGREWVENFNRAVEATKTN